MKISIKLEERVAEVHVIPTSPLDKAHLSLLRSYGSIVKEVGLGAQGELVFVLAAPVGKENNGAIEEEPEQAGMS